jgi:hypothetical protein
MRASSFLAQRSSPSIRKLPQSTRPEWPNEARLDRRTCARPVELRTGMAGTPAWAPPQPRLHIARPRMLTLSCSAVSPRSRAWTASYMDGIITVRDAVTHGGLPGSRMVFVIEPLVGRGLFGSIKKRGHRHQFRPTEMKDLRRTKAGAFHLSSHSSVEVLPCLIAPRAAN